MFSCGRSKIAYKAGTQRKNWGAGRGWGARSVARGAAGWKGRMCRGTAGFFPVARANAAVILAECRKLPRAKQPPQRDRVAGSDGQAVEHVVDAGQRVDLCFLHGREVVRYFESSSPRSDAQAAVRESGPSEPKRAHLGGADGQSAVLLHPQRPPPHPKRLPQHPSNVFLCQTFVPPGSGSGRFMG